MTRRRDERPRDPVAVAALDRAEAERAQAWAEWDRLGMAHAPDADVEAAHAAYDAASQRWRDARAVLLHGSAPASDRLRRGLGIEVES